MTKLIKYNTVQYGMRSRLTYLPLDMVEQFDDFIISKDKMVLDALRARTRDFSMLTVLKLLYYLQNGPTTFTQLYAGSKIRMKHSFLNYLHMCLSYNFIQHDKIKSQPLYSITEKGLNMISLFTQKSN
ncbi:MAG: hypothetical protein R1F52_07260 [Candidatus Nitrosoabyssus spongiisocia]|nr:MAG: hypothetical protein R1F52_07260 [Nitrosopumilaceae archaeon AB1(1)]